MRLDKKRSAVRTMAKMLHKWMADYEEVWAEAKALGMISNRRGSITRDQWIEIESLLSTFVERLSSTTTGEASK